MIYSNYPFLVTKKGFAFHPSFLTDDNSTVGVKQTTVETEASTTDNSSQTQKKQKLDVNGTFAPSALVGELQDLGEEEAADEQKVRGDNNETQLAASALKPDWACLNLWDEEYVRDRRPLMKGCGCLACSKHTRAYIHHLLKSKELLAEILLYQHNQYQMLKMFDEVGKTSSIREWIANRVETYQQQQQH